MGSVALKKVALLLIFLIAVFTSFEVGTTRAAKAAAATKGQPNEPGGEEYAGTHYRSLSVRTNDYGNYDPPPTFQKPPPKTIPN